jgi:CDP-glycerol glycerophosphotransferase
LGRKNNPFPYVKGADVFVLSSDYEGLPTVLYEALILGVPCVSTAVAGADEILEPGIGIITPKSEEALFSGIRDMLSDGKYKEYKKNAAEYRFSVEEILGQIEGLLQ